MFFPHNVSFRRNILGSRGLSLPCQIRIAARSPLQQCCLLSYMSCWWGMTYTVIIHHMLKNTWNRQNASHHGTAQFFLLHNSFFLSWAYIDYTIPSNILFNHSAEVVSFLLLIFHFPWLTGCSPITLPLSSSLGKSFFLSCQFLQW